MAQVDQALQRAAYDIGYKGELIGVLEAEVVALREGRTADADVLRRAREAAVQPSVPEPEQFVESTEAEPAALATAPVDEGLSDPQVVADDPVSEAVPGETADPAGNPPVVTPAVSEDGAPVERR
jgi:hypothetical protein